MLLKKKKADKNISSKKTVKPAAKKSALPAARDVRKFANDYGYFSEDGREFVITRPDTPKPWINVHCFGDYGTVVSQTGSGFSWKENSNLSRINRWEQDMVRDEWGKYIYVRDKANGRYWSLTWKPLRPEFDAYEVRYGQGYSIFRSSYSGIDMEKTIIVDMKYPVEVWKVKLTNKTNAYRELSLFTYFEFQLGNWADAHREFHKTFMETEIDCENGAIYGRKRPALVPKSIAGAQQEAPIEAFHACNQKPAAYEGDKEAFFGRYGDLQRPRALLEGKLLNTQGKWGDAAASLQVDVELAPGESKEVLFLLGATADTKEIAKILSKYRAGSAFNEELKNIRAFWTEWVDEASIDTPDEAMNFMTNIWLKHQAVTARLWAKCAYYQSSGGIGFRDQLQDSHIFLPIKPELTKKQILLHAEQQFPDGTVYHWWHPKTDIAAHTEMTDDLLWLSLLTMNYIDETGDETIWDEKAPYVHKGPGKPETGTIYNHCIRAFDKVFSRFSKRGLPLIIEGDWNDGLSHVGLEKKGESIWLAQFLYSLLVRFAPYAAKQGEKKRAEQYLAKAEALKKAINQYAWDGEWYFGASRDDGRLLGSKTSPEGKIYLNTQTWAVISNSATGERAKIAMKSAEKYLFREYGALLLTPAYSVTDNLIGYITRYAPSIRENGGVYTHAATWFILAEAMLGNGDTAHEAFRRINPILRGLDADRYCAEPYVTPGNVDGPDSPHFGRGGWTWYTGSAAWLFRVAWEGILGIRPEKDGLRIDPCVPKAWGSFAARRKFRGAVYKIEVSNPQGVNRGVKSITVDGKKIEGTLLKPFKDGKVHKVKVVLG